MRDGPLRRLVKLATRLLVAPDVHLARLVARLRGGAQWTLAGTCGMCAQCCEEPSIQVGRIVWFLPTPRRLFLLWQKHVNGFELVRAEPGRVFAFRCTHFDPKTRRCDSYDSRPFLCRDYPRVLLQQPWPELLPGCGYRPVAPGAERMLVQLDATGLSPEKKQELARKLRLER